MVKKSPKFKKFIPTLPEEEHGDEFMSAQDEKELEKIVPLLARLAVGAGAGMLEEMSTPSSGRWSLQKVAPFTPSRKRHDDDLGSEPEFEKTFHDDIDTGAGLADAATTVGAALLGAYLGGKLGKKLGRGLSGISDAMKNVNKGTADYQQATTWPQEKGIAGDIGAEVGRAAGDAVGKKFSKQGNPFAIATSQAKKLGYDDFSEGSTGKKKRGEIAEAIKEDSVDKLLKAVEGLKEGLIDGGQAGEQYTDSSENIDKPKKKSELIPEDHKPPEAFMTKEDSCGCDGSSTTSSSDAIVTLGR